MMSYKPENGKNGHRYCLLSVFLSLAVFLSWAADLEAAQGMHGAAEKVSVYDNAGGWKLQTLDGKEIAFSDCRGKVVFLNFWATWCVPCVAEMPSIAKLCRAMKQENIVFLIVSTEPSEKVAPFVKKNPCDLPIYISQNEVPKVFKTNRLPLTFFLDRDGGIAFRCTGSTQWEDPAYQDLLRGLTRR